MTAPTYHSTAQAAARSGVPVSTLKRLDANGIICPIRALGCRLYTDDDIARLRAWDAQRPT